jgi:hypothetical protein
VSGVRRYFERGERSDIDPSALEVSDLPDGPLALGTRYRVRLKFFGPVNFLIDEFEPGGCTQRLEGP